MPSDRCSLQVPVQHGADSLVPAPAEVGQLQTVSDCSSRDVTSAPSQVSGDFLLQVFINHINIIFLIYINKALFLCRGRTKPLNYAQVTGSDERKVLRRLKHEKSLSRDASAARKHSYDRPVLSALEARMRLQSIIGRHN